MWRGDIKMLTIKEAINRERRGNRYSYIELYDIDTEMPIYKGVAWDYPYDMSYIVHDYQVYNIDNKVCFTMWVDFTIWDVENAIDDYMSNLTDEDNDNDIMIPYDETIEIHNTPIGEMTDSEFIEWVNSFGRP